MDWANRRERFRATLNSGRCIHPASVYDPISARIAEDLGFEAAMLAVMSLQRHFAGDICVPPRPGESFVLKRFPAFVRLGSRHIVQRPPSPRDRRVIQVKVRLIVSRRKS